MCDHTRVQRDVLLRRVLCWSSALLTPIWRQCGPAGFIIGPEPPPPAPPHPTVQMTRMDAAAWLAARTHFPIRNYIDVIMLKYPLKMFEHVRQQQCAFKSFSRHYYNLKIKQWSVNKNMRQNCVWSTFPACHRLRHHVFECQQDVNVNV